MKFLSNLNANLSFLKIYLLAGSSFLAVECLVVMVCLLFSRAVSDTLLDFLRFDFRGLDDSVVGLLFNFLESFLGSSF